VHEGDYLAITYKEERAAYRALKFGESLSSLRLNSACFSCMAWNFITAWHCESQEQQGRAFTADRCMAGRIFEWNATDQPCADPWDSPALTRAWGEGRRYNASKQ
jgi:hypothetical protein